MSSKSMLKFNSVFLTILFLLGVNQAMAQDSIEEQVEKDSIEQIQRLEIGIAFDYLKLHTLLLEESEKWEGAVNFKIWNKISAVASFGMAKLSPEEAYKNAAYLSEGIYYRVGLDYHFIINPNNFIFVGLRYGQASFDEHIAYEIGNPLFENEKGELNRNELSAYWFELLVTSEKRVRTIFKKDIPDFLSIGFKFRLKSLQEYDDFPVFRVKNIPGYGRTNMSLNPELNLYIKFRIPIF